MLKIGAAVLLLTFFLGCHNNVKPVKKEDVLAVNNNNDSLQKLNDTFYYRYLDELKMYEQKYSPAFSFDTIEYTGIKSKIHEYLLVPFTRNPVVDKNLRKGVFGIRNAFFKDNSGLMIDEDTKKYVGGGAVDVWPANLYKNNQIISGCFELCYSDSVLMRSYCQYDCLNYDTRGNRFIKFSDFFDIRTSEDSLYFKRLILAAVSEEHFVYQLSLDNRLDFSMNDAYIFFYFDAYELSAPFDIGGGVRKKYLNKFIKEIYK